MTGFSSDARPRQGGLTLLIAGLVTAAITVPLLLAALDARDQVEPADSFGISVRLSGDSAVVAAANADLPEGTSAELVLDDPAFIGGSWVLYPVGGDLLGSGEAQTLPLVVDYDLSTLPPGAYDLLVTATLLDGTQVNRAARFRVIP